VNFRIQKDYIVRVSVILTHYYYLFTTMKGYFTRYGDGLRAGRPGFESQQGKIFLFSITSRAHPASYPMGTGVFSPGVMRLGREVVRSHPSSAEVHNGGAILPLSHMSSWYRA
jgi:hypothetical protein